VCYCVDVLCNVPFLLVPSLPLNVTITTGGMLRALVVNWQPPSNPGGIITTYMVTYGNITVDTGDDNTSYTIMGLNLFTNYTISVAACTENGCGNQTVNLIGTTAEEGMYLTAIEKKAYFKLLLAPNPPQNIAALVINSTTVVVTWDPPSITNGILRYYTVVYGSSDDMEMMEVNSSDVTVLVSVLDPFTNYTFYVLAVTVVPSEPSDNVTVVTDEAGTVPLKRNVALARK